MVFLLLLLVLVVDDDDEEDDDGVKSCSLLLGGFWWCSLCVVSFLLTCSFFSLFNTTYLRMIIRKRDGGATEDSLLSSFCHLVLKMKLCPYDENTKSGRKKAKHPKFTFKDTHFFTSIRS